MTNAQAALCDCWPSFWNGFLLSLLIVLILNIALAWWVFLSDREMFRKSTP